MVYIKYFETEEEKQACTDTYKYLAYTEDSNKVNIHQPHDYLQDYLTFVAKSSGTFNFTGFTSGTTTNNIQYSTDNGTTWAEPSKNVTVKVNNGNNVLWKSSNLTPFEKQGIGTFSASTAQFDVEGNIMSLLNGDNFVNQTDLNGKNYVFYQLFDKTKCINANNLVLPATTLANYCYNGMFSGCTSLTTAPELPATPLANGCYQSMFNGCKSLTTAPQLPATTLATSCYRFMFQGCTSLTTAPQLPATTLAASCYQSMFGGCTNLNYIKAMFTTTPSTIYTSNWVSGVAAIGTFVKNTNAKWTTTGTYGIPTGWNVETASA